MSLETQTTEMLKEINNGAAFLDQKIAVSDTKEIQDDKETDDAKIKQLAALSLLEYERVRVDVAKQLECRPAILDALVKVTRKEKNVDKLPFNEVEPCFEEIKPSQLLNEVSETIKRFIVLDDEEADAATLWIAYSWFIDVAEIAPLAIVNAPEKSCGKTQLLTVLGRMCYRPLPASNATLSALFRAVELWRPTILIDEADTFFRENYELHGMVNAGYLRDGYVLRSEATGDTFEPRMFSVFSPKALAGIALEKHLPDATMSRGIVFNLRRKLSNESVQRLRHANKNLFTSITRKLARFAQDYSESVRLARPTLPDALNDRQQDNWDGLFAIAACAGDEWVKRATEAALKLSISDKAISTGNELLSDIQTILKTKSINKISTADLIDELCHDSEAPWSTYNKGRPISGRQLARQLKPYGIFSKDIKFSYGNTLKGFSAEMFEDAFNRYIATPPEIIRYPQLPNASKGSEVADSKTLSATIRDPQPFEDDKLLEVAHASATRNLSATSKSLPDKGSCPVADKAPQSGNAYSEDKTKSVRI